MDNLRAEIFLPFEELKIFRPFDNSLLPETTGKMPKLQTHAKHQIRLYMTR